MTTLTISRDTQDAPAPQPYRPGMYSATTSGNVAYLYRLRDPRFMLLEPIALKVETGEEGEIVTYADDLQVYGAGETFHDAAEDFQSMLVDLYEELQASEDSLSWALQDTLYRLRCHVREA